MTIAIFLTKLRERPLSFSEIMPMLQPNTKQKDDDHACIL